MRKKILAFFTVACLGLSYSTTAFAGGYSDGEFTYLNENGDTASSEISYYADSSYIVKIPIVINDIVYSGYSFTASEMNLLDSQAVNVYCTSDVTMTNERGDSFMMNIHNTSDYSSLVGSFTNGEYQSDLLAIGQADLGNGTIKAGQYSGTATFEIRLELNN